MANQAVGYGASGMDELPGFTQLGGIGLILNIVGLFAWTWTALIVFAYVAIALVAEATPLFRPRIDVEHPDASWTFTAGYIALLGSIIWALIGGAIVANLDWVSYSVAAWITLGLFALRIILYLAARCFEARAAMLNVLLFGVLAACVQVLPPPPDSPERRAEERKITSIIVTVTDETAKPLSGLKACVQWHQEGFPAPPDEQIGSDCAQTNDVGEAVVWMILFDPASKIATIDVVESYEYQPARRVLSGMTRGETRKLEVSLARNPERFPE